jgi:hypothetical protein
VWWCRPTPLVLEVGTTRISKTLQHLRGTGVARWPYGYSEIIALVTYPSAF